MLTRRAASHGSSRRLAEWAVRVNVDDTSRRGSNALMISPSLLESVLAKLALPSGPTLDLAGLNQTYAAYSGKIPNDNIHKRIWLVGTWVQRNE
jgi:hypothetical protein